MINLFHYLCLSVITINSRCFICYNRTHGNVILGPHDVCIYFPQNFSHLTKNTYSML